MTGGIVCAWKTMESKYSVIYNGRYVEIISVGRKSIAHSRQMYVEVQHVCELHECFRLLGISLSEGPMSINDAFDHAGLFQELGIDSNYKLAWVETNHDAMEPLEFAEDVLHNRGLPGRLFKTIEAARTWLLDDKP